MAPGEQVLVWLEKPFPVLLGWNNFAIVEKVIGDESDEISVACLG